MNILSKIQPSDVSPYPFPHVIVEDAIDREVANQLLAEIPSLESIGKIRHGNQRISMGYDRAMNLATPPWREFLSIHVSQEFCDDFSRVFGFPRYRVGIRHRDSFNDTEMLLDAQICANTPADTPSSVRGPHVDTPEAIFAGLLYLRHPNDDSIGGDLQLFEIKKDPVFHWGQFVDEKYVRAVKTIPYKHNTFIVFPNSVHAVHGVTVRQPTKWPRYFVNFVGDVGHDMFYRPHEGRIKAWWRGKKPKGY